MSRSTSEAEIRVSLPVPFLRVGAEKQNAEGTLFRRRAVNNLDVLKIGTMRLDKIIQSISGW